MLNLKLFLQSLGLDTNGHQNLSDKIYLLLLKVMLITTWERGGTQILILGKKNIKGKGSLGRGGGIVKIEICKYRKVSGWGGGGVRHKLKFNIHLNYSNLKVKKKEKSS